MAWPPAAAKLLVNVALPPVPTATVPRTTLPSLKVTVPVGVPPPGATVATVAVKVTAWPVTAGLTDGFRATVVAAGLTVRGVTAGRESQRRLERNPKRTVTVSGEHGQPVRDGGLSPHSRVQSAVVIEVAQGHIAVPAACFGALEDGSSEGAVAMTQQHPEF